jgi:SUMO ligase MMS21 Smc5/6 complex component
MHVLLGIGVHMSYHCDLACKPIAHSLLSVRKCLAGRVADNIKGGEVRLQYTTADYQVLSLLAVH